VTQASNYHVIVYTVTGIDADGNAIKSEDDGARQQRTVQREPEAKNEETHLGWARVLRGRFSGFCRGWRGGGQARDAKRYTDKRLSGLVSGKTESGLVQDWISATDSTGTFMVNALPPGQYTFAPANEPSATANFSIKPTTTPNTNLGAIQVAPGVKF
jgi:hypothetical protein